ncbi:MAG: tRNA (adenosine(37)-N6)-dimethylallyltransferase MiaA [Muribaculaceae bacterium]|nr:tRNA (adenosine(37)-N6)-dimethylallyltransferase MiaA [Muribaculaceae bacterium]
MSSVLMKKAIVITGPTASGKSALAIEVARRLDTHIISADSRQIYHGIPIVTAVPSPEQLAAVPHHLIEVLPLDAYYSASMFEQHALQLCNEIFAENDTVVVCGGSMMYIDAFCNGIDPLPTVPDTIRQQLTELHTVNGNEWLLQRLQELDPIYYEQVDRNNIKRVFHAVEIIMTAGQPYSTMRTGQKVHRDFEIEKYYIDMPRQQLFERINNRVDAMVSAGLEEEAAAVSHLRGLNSLNTVGLKEMFAYFDGEMSRETAIERIKKNTRVYAKKQMTWFAKDTELLDASILEKSVLGNEYAIEY